MQTSNWNSLFKASSSKHPAQTISFLGEMDSGKKTIVDALLGRSHSDRIEQLERLNLSPKTKVLAS